MNQVELRNMLDEVKRKYRDRKIVLYGKSDEVKKCIEKAGLNVLMTVTGNKDILADKTYRCYPVADIKDRAKEYFVICPFILPDGGQSQKQVLERLGYEERDYVFLPKVFMNGAQGKYYDDFENKIDSDCFCGRINIEGIKNTIEIDNKGTTGDLEININGSNNKIVIGKNCCFKKKMSFYVSANNSVIVLGDSIVISGGKVFIHDNSELRIGERFTTSSEGLHILLHQNTKIEIGKDCMFSWNVELQTGDGHPIFDVINGENINLHSKNESRYMAEIKIGEHVWIGHDALVFASKKVTSIGTGSIIGTRSLVKGMFSNNVVLAGIPARVIRKNVAWSRKPYSEDIHDCAGYTDYTCEI